MFLLVNEKTNAVIMEFASRFDASTIEWRVANWMLEYPLEEAVDINDYAVYKFDYYGQDIRKLKTTRANLITGLMRDIYTREYDYLHKDEHKEEW